MQVKHLLPDFWLLPNVFPYNRNNHIVVRINPADRYYRLLEHTTIFKSAMKETWSNAW